MGLQRFNQLTPLNNEQQILNADGTGLVNIMSAQGQSYFLGNVLVTNTDGIVHTIELWINEAGADTLIGSYIIAAGQGQAGTPSIDLLKQVLPPAMDGMPMDGSAIVKAKTTVAVVAPNALYFFIVAGAV